MRCIASWDFFLVVVRRVGPGFKAYEEDWVSWWH